MKTLLFHCKRYVTKIVRISNRPGKINPEKINRKRTFSNECIVVLLTIEKRDKINKCCPELKKEIVKMVREVGHKNIVLLPFAHLSNKLADSKKSLGGLNYLEKSLQEENFSVLRDHFGSHKSLLLDIYGHPGNARYREF
ncbi:MAG: threonyl-tRNA synthetase editing domain-containing protein [Candidatus Pacearchaeota archaeon]